MPARKPLPLPSFYDPANAERYDYTPDQMRLFVESAEWRRAHGITASATDKRNVHMLLIDYQRDFAFPEGTLYVGGRSGRGALDDNRRASEFIYRHLHQITNVTATMDTHFAFQIFFPSFWVDSDDQPLKPYREITVEQIDRGEVRPNPAIASWICNGNYPWLLKQSRHYCAELERAGKYRLYLWPPHCILGSSGHGLAGVIHEARMFHAYVRGVQSWVEVKGGHALTENYSVLRPEVLTRFNNVPLAQRNTSFVRTLLSSDMVIVAGQAASHCVKSTVEDLLNEISAQDPALARKVYLLEDCMSAVAIPDGKGGFVADFTPEAEKALQAFAAAGMHVVRSTDPIESWPDVDP